MKVVISASRFSPEVETLKKHLADLFSASGIGLTTYSCAEDAPGLSHVYFCEDHATNSNVMKQRDEIDPIIADADWVIVVVPLNHVGKYTNHEIQCAVKAFYKNRDGSPVLSILNCIDYYDFDENKTIEKGYNIESFDNENCISIEQVKIRVAQTIREAKGCDADVESELSDVFIEEYCFDKDGIKLKEKLTDVFQKNLADKKFRSLHLVAVSRLGKEINAADLYFNKERASEANGFSKDKYYPRESVDGLLETAIDEQRKYIMLLGAPGSGKTRAVYQMLASSERIELNGRSRFSMGRFSDKNIIVLRQDNVRKIYELLKLEKSFSKYLEQCVYKWKPKEYILVCDQIKNVFQMLHENADLYEFFDLIDDLPNIRMVGTSIPSAFKKFAERWKDYGYNPMNDDERTMTITIPKISGDKDEIDFRNWIYNEFSFSGEINRKGIETIGDCIENLNKYKEDIVEKLYNKSEYKYMGPLLSSIQTIETFRYDTALFLPILVAKERISESTGYMESDFKTEIIKTINYLLANNVIWIANSDGIIMNRLDENNIIGKRKKFSLSGEEKYTFDDELYDDPIFPTTFSYGVNEIIWEHLEKVDRERHLKSETSGCSPMTMLFDFQKKDGVIACAELYYAAVERLSTLRRILPRIPRTACQAEVLDELCRIVFGICKESDVGEEKDEFLLTMGILIGRAKNVDTIKDVLKVIHDKGITPDYNIIGELYSACIRLGEKDAAEIEVLIGKIRKEHKLEKNNIFSLTRQLSYQKTDWEKSLELIHESELLFGDECVKMTDYESIAGLLNQSALIRSNLIKLFDILVNKAKGFDNWVTIFTLHKSYNVCVKRKFMRQFFAVVAEENNKNEHEANSLNSNLFLDRIKFLFENYDVILAKEDKKSPFFYAMRMVPDFKRAKPIYDYYYEQTGHDDTRLVSMAMSCVLDREFQMALLFLLEVDERFKRQGNRLNNICFNNLIKVAPNADEAINVLQHLPWIQDYTLASILNIIKNKRKGKEDKKVKDDDNKNIDPKLFYYAYNVIMLDVFSNFRENPSRYVIGLLYDLATTPKQEQFIRDKYLLSVPEYKKSELIDYSTAIASIRITKNYRTLEQVWSIFNTCRNHYKGKSSYRASELYSNMLRKIAYLCKDDNDLLQVQLNKMKGILKEDQKFLVLDEHFIVSVFRYFDDKNILDGNGNLTRDFKELMDISNVQNIRVLNNLLFLLKKQGFDKMWKFYEYILYYYEKRGKWQYLRPDIRTITYILETVREKEQRDKVDGEAKRWLSENTYNSNKLFSKKRDDLQKQFSTDCTLKRDESKTDSQPEKEDTEETYLQRTGKIINSFLADINNYGGCTPTLINMYLKNLKTVIDDVKKDKTLKNKGEIIENIYSELLNSLITPKRDKLEFNGSSYLSLIKLAPQKECGKWIEEMNKLNNGIIHHLDICREMATEMKVAYYDIDISFQYFKYWQDIMNNIGYAFDDENSYTVLSKKSQFNKRVDYDSFWKTYYYHTVCVMHRYCNRKKFEGCTDLSFLGIIKKNLNLFEQNNVQIPVYNYKGMTFDFKKEIEEQGV